MQPEPIVTNTTPHYGTKKHLQVRKPLLLVLLVVGVCALAVPMLVSKYRALNTQTAEVPAVVPEAVKTEPEVLGGKIYMSLAPLDAGTHYALDIYSYDVLTESLEQETEDIGREYLTSKFSPDGTKMAFASFTNDGDNMTGNSALFIKDLVNDEIVEVEIAEDVAVRRNPSWSLDGKHIVFAALKGNDVDPLTPENWSVYTHTLGSEETARRVTEGANPVFLPNGNIAVLKHDGLYSVNADGSSQTQVYKFSTSTQTNVKFDVSRDGTQIALSLPNANQLVVIPVRSWEPMETGDLRIIPASTFWPVFSPGGEYLAMQVFEWSDETPERIPTNQRLLIYSLRDKKWLNSFDLLPYDQNMLFITDWK